MNRLKELRKAKGLTQKQVGNDLSIPQNTYSNYERGDRKPPLVVLKILADYFDVSVDYLIGHEKTPNHVE
ncbi:helix-turn-helix transcriptional regulator [Weissella paramesenteroides]|uniref:helix-turn-helix domain-containing protein n=1 Tax=Weissella paramesenteroides TaxID=1249 RepID=UPI0023F6D037|nr:helix-turn-helix transcriptional regulator [Weissella paramesenteroides]MDF8375182.1 helix-turn-helix transcriptional regulator [Weissella paramesenteroides]